MNIPSDKFPVFEKIMSGETPVLVCANEGEYDLPKSISPSVKTSCVLCGRGLLMQAANQEKKKELNAVELCALCCTAIVAISGPPGNSTRSMVSGKIMSVEDGYRQVELLKRRN